MNHDYEHCADYTDACPKKCFRAKLTKEILTNPTLVPNGCVSWMNLKDTGECMRGEDDERSDQ